MIILNFIIKKPHFSLWEKEAGSGSEPPNKRSPMSSLRTGPRLCNPCISFHTETENISKVTNRNTDHLGQGLGEIYLGQCPKQIETTWDFIVLLLFGGRTLLRLPRDSAQQGIMPLNPLKEGPLGRLRLARPPQRRGLHWSLEWLSPGLRGDSTRCSKSNVPGMRVCKLVSDHRRMAALHMHV